MTILPLKSFLKILIPAMLAGGALPFLVLAGANKDGGLLLLSLPTLIGGTAAAYYGTKIAILEFSTRKEKQEMDGLLRAHRDLKQHPA